LTAVYNKYNIFSLIRKYTKSKGVHKWSNTTTYNLYINMAEIWLGTFIMGWWLNSVTSDSKFKIHVGTIYIVHKNNTNWLTTFRSKYIIMTLWPAISYKKKPHLLWKFRTAFRVYYNIIVREGENPSYRGNF